MNSLKKIAFILFLISIVQCKKEEIKEIEIENKWMTHESFLYENKVQSNSFVDDDKIFFMGRNFSTFSIDQLNPNELEIEHYSIPSYLTEYKPPISSLFFPLPIITGSSVAFISSKNPVLVGANIWVSIAEIDTSFGGFTFPIYSISEGALINNNNQCLIPYSEEVSPGSNAVLAEPKFLITEIGYKPGSEFLDTISSCKIIENLDLGILKSLNSIDEYFFITGENKTIRISLDLNIELAYDGIMNKIFKYKNKYFGTTRHDFFESNNKGLDWQIINQFNVNFNNFNFYEIDDYLIGSFFSQLFHFDFSNNNLEIKEISNNGLEGNEITSISLFKEKIYITTLSGVFEKELEMLIEYKE